MSLTIRPKSVAAVAVLALLLVAVSASAAIAVPPPDVSPPVDTANANEFGQHLKMHNQRHTGFAGLNHNPGYHFGVVESPH